MTDIKKLTVSMPTVAAVLLFAAGATSNYYTSKMAVESEVAALNAKLDLFIERQQGKDAITELRINGIEKSGNENAVAIASLRVAILPEKPKRVNEIE